MSCYAAALVRVTFEAIRKLQNGQSNETLVNLFEIVSLIIFIPMLCELYLICTLIAPIYRGYRADHESFPTGGIQWNIDFQLNILKSSTDCRIQCSVACVGFSLKHTFKRGSSAVGFADLLHAHFTRNSKWWYFPNSNVSALKWLLRFSTWV